MPVVVQWRTGYRLDPFTDVHFGMKRSGGGEEGAGGRIGNGSFFGAATMVMSSSSPSSSISDNSSNRNLMQQQQQQQQTALESPTSRLGCLSLQHQEQEQEERERQQQQQQQQCVVASSSTTFVHVDTCNFREVVQKLTGASEHDGLEKFPVTLPARQAARAAAAAAAGGGAGAGTDKLSDITCKGLVPKPVGDLSARRPASFKLHERRQAFLLRSLDVKDLRLSSSLRRGSSGYGSGFCSPTSEVSPRFNSSLMPSPVTPLTSNVFDNNAYGCSNNTSNSYTSPGPREKHGGQEELQDGDDAGRRPTTVESRDGRFMLHSSPPTLEKPRRIPELLTLFPLTSPRASEPPT